MTAAEDGRVLADWWHDRAQDEIDKTIPKAVEYGSGDLAEIGRAMGRVMGREGMSHQDATELGIFFYLVGKIARWEQAIKDGRRASDDTLFDIGVYTKMAQRNRDVGGWPWAPDPESTRCQATRSEHGRVYSCDRTHNDSVHHNREHGYQWIDDPNHGLYTGRTM